MTELVPPSSDRARSGAAARAHTRASRRLGWPALVGLAMLALLSIAGTVALALNERTPPPRCPAGLVPLGARCCGEGQTLRLDACYGVPVRCAEGMLTHPDGCVAQPIKIRIAGGVPSFRTSDWHPARDGRGSKSRLAPYRMDATEVTVSRWQSCVTAGVCKPLDRQLEPGRPITDVTPEAANKFCRFMGGRLPKASEWVFAASSGQGRSYPWGQTGLVCRRAAFGLVEGPCAEGAEGPDLAGARIAGGTPEGLLDMAGNVAEWTREADGRFAARGGSYKTRVAADLKTWAAEPRSTPARHVGFRCAYHAEDPK